MQKTILITGSTDGIGLETAKMLLGKGHRVLLHGRNEAKLAKVEADLSSFGQVESYAADLSRMAEVDALAKAVAARHKNLDVLINNAGVLKVPDAITPEGIDMRFMVNTLAPYRLTEQLAPLLGKDARVVNLSSAAQDTVNADALRGGTRLGDMAAYSQTSWP